MHDSTVTASNALAGFKLPVKVSTMGTSIQEIDFQDGMTVERVCQLADIKLGDSTSLLVTGNGESKGQAVDKSHIIQPGDSVVVAPLANNG